MSGHGQTSYHGAEAVVVGAGPTGLWVACELALAGVRTTVLERRTSPSRHSRALGVMPRTLEVLAMRDAHKPFLAAGRQVPAWHFGLLERPIDFTSLDTPFAYMLTVPQTVTERLLEERAIALGVEIRRGARVIGIEQDPIQAHVTVERFGEVEHLSAGLVLGCDGARSTVRDLAGIRFVGEDSSRWGFLADVALDNPPRPGYRTRSAKGALIVAPLPEGRFRVTGWDPVHQDAQEELSVEVVEDFVRRIADSDFGIRDATWLSRFGDANKLAEMYRSGRVLLAGDAAHVHWPTGGLGLNAGIQDAMSLGWRAAAFLRGAADTDTLDVYADERRAYGQRLRSSTLAQSALIAAEKPDALALRKVLDGILSSPASNAAVAADIAGISDLPDPLSAVPTMDGLRLPPSAVGGSDAFVGLFQAGKSVLLTTDSHTRAVLEQALQLATDSVAWASRAALTVDGLDLRAVLVHPDGRIGWSVANGEEFTAREFNAALARAGITTRRAV